MRSLFCLHIVEASSIFARTVAAREYTCRTRQVCGRPTSEATDAEVPEAAAVSAAMLLSQHQHLHYHEGSAQQQATSGGDPAAVPSSCRSQFGLVSANSAVSSHAPTEKTHYLQQISHEYPCGLEIPQIHSRAFRDRDGCAAKLKFAGSHMQQLLYPVQSPSGSPQASQQSTSHSNCL